MSLDNSEHQQAKQPSPVNFGLVVASAFVFLLVALLAAYLFLKKDATKVVPHPPTATPNSSLSVPTNSRV